MLFKRREAPTWMEQIRVWIWPRRSWLRSTQYVTKRILRITATPHAIAAGVAAGVFTSFTPFMGLHFIVAIVLAWLLRGNLIASALGTFFGNPISFPFIWTATLTTGNTILGNQNDQSGLTLLGGAMKDILHATFSGNMSEASAGLLEIWTPVLYPMLIGGLILGPLFGIPAYFLTRRGTMLFRERRRDQLIKKAADVKSKARELVDKKTINVGANQT